MRVLRTITELKEYLRDSNHFPGCFADSGFLYALAFQDDSRFDRANDVLEVLAETKFSIYANVIVRMEFIDLLFRKQVTLGCVQLLPVVEQHARNKALFRVLRNIRDQNTASFRVGVSFKVGERQLKDLKRLMDEFGVETDWTDFCSNYVGSMLKTEWQMLEEDFDLRFVELLEGQVTELFNQPLTWSDMVDVMADKGLRGPDAMIANMYARSRFPLLVTVDSDLINPRSFPNESQAVFIL